MAVNHGGAAHGVQFQINADAFSKIVLSRQWKDFCQSLAEAMKIIAQRDISPDDHSLLYGDPNRGIAPPGDYKDHYEAFVDDYGGHYNAVLANTKRNAIWIETGTHPGGVETNYVPGHHIMTRAMEAAFAYIRSL